MNITQPTPLVDKEEVGVRGRSLGFNDYEYYNFGLEEQDYGFGEEDRYDPGFAEVNYFYEHEYNPRVGEIFYSEDVEDYSTAVEPESEKDSLLSRIFSIFF